jgi:hypothetical protein
MLNLTALLVLFDKSRLMMTAPFFSFTLPHLTFVTQTYLKHKTTHTCTHPWHLLLLIKMHHLAMWPGKVETSKVSRRSACMHVSTLQFVKLKVFRSVFPIFVIVSRVTRHIQFCLLYDFHVQV